MYSDSKNTTTQNFTVLMVNSNHGKWKLSKKFAKSHYSL